MSNGQKSFLVVPAIGIWYTPVEHRDLWQTQVKKRRKKRVLKHGMARLTTLPAAATLPTLLPALTKQERVRPRDAHGIAKMDRIPAREYRQAKKDGDGMQAAFENGTLTLYLTGHADAVNAPRHCIWGRRI